MKIKAKQIPGFSDYYITNTGSVYSIKDGKITKLNPWIDDYGYERVTVGKDSSDKTVNLRIHRLVADAFVEKPKDNKDADLVNHKDGNKKNNIAINLVWADPKENTDHAYENGLAKGPKGEVNGKSKLTKKQVEQIRKSDEKNVDLSKKYNVSAAQISYIKSGDRW